MRTPRQIVVKQLNMAKYEKANIKPPQILSVRSIIWQAKIDTLNEILDLFDEEGITE